MSPKLVGVKSELHNDSKANKSEKPLDTQK